MATWVFFIISSHLRTVSIDSFPHTPPFVYEITFLLICMSPIYFISFIEDSKTETDLPSLTYTPDATADPRARSQEPRPPRGLQGARQSSPRCSLPGRACRARRWGGEHPSLKHEVSRRPLRCLSTLRLLHVERAAFPELLVITVCSETCLGAPLGSVSLGALHCPRLCSVVFVDLYSAPLGRLRSELSQ